MVHDAILDFFRRFGTHFLPGPVLFGGMLIAHSEELNWKQISTNDGSRAKEHVDCKLRNAVQ